MQLFSVQKLSKYIYIFGGDSISAMEQAQRIKVALVGEGGVGKTAFLTQIIEGRFERRYMATTGVEMRSLEFSTNHGSVIFDVWDTAGQEKFRGVPEAYFNGSHACKVIWEIVNFLRK